eukprot:12043362-Prorocentrum_lima.AAC.1
MGSPAPVVAAEEDLEKAPRDTAVPSASDRSPEEVTSAAKSHVDLKPADSIEDKQVPSGSSAEHVG